MPNPKVTKEVRKPVPLPPMERVEVEYETTYTTPDHPESGRVVWVNAAKNAAGVEGVQFGVRVAGSGVYCHQLLGPKAEMTGSMTRTCAEALVLALARFYDLPYTPPEGRK